MTSSGRSRGPRSGGGLVMSGDQRRGGDGAEAPGSLAPRVDDDPGSGQELSPRTERRSREGPALLVSGAVESWSGRDTGRWPGSRGPSMSGVFGARRATSRASTLSQCQCSPMFVDD